MVNLGFVYYQLAFCLFRLSDINGHFSSYFCIITNLLSTVVLSVMQKGIRYSFCF